MGVLRWWFTLNYDAVTADAGPPGLRHPRPGREGRERKRAALGRRQADPHGRVGGAEPASSPTASPTHFDALCQKYPIYAELRNLFDLALVCALVREEGLADKVGWHLTCFGNPQGLCRRAGRRAQGSRDGDQLSRRQRQVHHCRASAAAWRRIRPRWFSPAGDRSLATTASRANRVRRPCRRAFRRQLVVGPVGWESSMENMLVHLANTTCVPVSTPRSWPSAPPHDICHQ